MIKIFFGIFALSLSLSSIAATPNCTAIKDPAKRLKCFDADQSKTAQTIETKDRKNEAAEDALKSLRKLRSASQMGVSLSDYGKLILDQIPSIDENLRSIPAGDLKSSIEQSKTAYIDARNVWSGMIQANYMTVFVSVYKPVYSKYAINPKYSELLDSSKSARSSDINQSYILGPIWDSAASSLAMAEQIISPAK